MAKATRSGLKETDPPDPQNDDAFRLWLLAQPPAWSRAIAARAALRIIPLLSAVAHRPDIVLPVLRATAVARFVARHPESMMTSVVDAAYANAANAAVLANAEAAAHVETDPNAAADAVYAAAYAAAAHYDATNAAAAVHAVVTADRVAGTGPRVAAAVQNDAKRLHDRATTSKQLATAPLWPGLPPPRIGGAWQGLAQKLRRRGDHWSVWIDWYDDVLAGTARSAAEDAAFTEIRTVLPWDKGDEAVNTEIARRLADIRQQIPNHRPITDIISDLAEVASPQPALTTRGQLDAIPNRAFDAPTADDDLSTLPLRQNNLIKIILSDLPRNAPAHLRASLHSYQEELLARGVQPILPLLKDDAEIIAAAVRAQRAEDEWLEPGMRAAFNIFDENHLLFVTYFPFDAQREAIYSKPRSTRSKPQGKS